MPNCEKGRMGMGGYHHIDGSEYHLFAECPDGDAIPHEYCRPGTGGLPLCPTCQNFADANRAEREKHYVPNRGPG